MQSSFHAEDAVDKGGSSQKSRRSLTMEAPPLVLPPDCELVADTFLVFQWQGRYCALQNNVTMYCWGQRRSGAIEHVLERYGWTHSSQLYRLSSKMVSESEWRWLRAIFVAVQRLFDDKETGDSIGRVRWLNIMECRLVFELLRRECYHHRRNAYPKASTLPSFMKSHGVEVDGWPDWYSAHNIAPALPAPTEEIDVSNAVAPSTPGSGSSSSSSSSSTASPSTRSPLGDREWLSDVDIANLMFLLLHGQLDLPLEMRDSFQCIYPMTDELFAQMLQRSTGPRGPNSEDTPLMHAKRGGGVTFAFINPNNNHWRLVVLDGRRPSQGRITLFDPLGTAFPPSVREALGSCMGPTFHMADLRSCLQAEGWNCGVWAIFIASRYAGMAGAAYADEEVADDASITGFLLRGGEDEYIVLDGHSDGQQRQQNRRFAQELRQQYAALLGDAEQSGRLLYTASRDDEQERGEEAQAEHLSAGDPSALTSAVWPRAGLVQVATGASGDPYRAGLSKVDPYRAGMARSAARSHRFINVPVAELVWIDLTDDVGAVEVEHEEEVEQSYEDLADNFIEFREDNIDRADAASLRYSLPAKLQSDVLQQQIVDFRAYRRQRFSLFRRGPLVEETTISGNIKSLLRFLGYLHYEQLPALTSKRSHTETSAPLDMTVFALPTISSLVLEYVEWLEQRRGSKRRAPDDHSFQPVSCATVSNYLNGLVSIVKFQLRHDLALREPLLDQLRNLRSQAESYAATQKRFEKVHPAWCSWPQLQLAREMCREAFDRSASDDEHDQGAYLLQLRELCLLCLFTICPPPRCSIIRLLEWDKTLVRNGPSSQEGRWVIDLTDPAHAASQHKTHKRKGALHLPLPAMLDPYLTELHARSRDRTSGAVFPASARARKRAIASGSMSPTVFTTFVKTTFGKYTEGGKAPNPSLLRSIFTTWLYGLRYDTEDAFLAQIKASSAQWKAHSEQIAATVYNKQLVYQQREFAALLRFCEAYSSRFAYDAGPGEDTAHQRQKSTRAGTRPVAGKRRQLPEADASASAGQTTDTYVVEQLIDIREDGEGVKQVLVAWEGYRRRTWELYDSIKQQLPELVVQLEQQLRRANDGDDDLEDDDDVDDGRSFLQAFIAQHGISTTCRWTPDRIAALELAASLRSPPVKITVVELVKTAIALVRGAP